MSGTRRTLEELIDLQEPGIRLVLDWAGQCARPVEVLPVDVTDAERTLLDLQITTRSPLGAVAYETGGILLDGGWLRILGAGAGKLPRTIASWNRLDRPRAEHRLPGALLVADDAIGGFFAINGGAFDGPLGNLFYLAPDTLRWEDQELGHTAWMTWLFTGDLPAFYQSLRWPGWEAEVAALTGDQCLAAGPPRRVIPTDEAWDLHTSVYFASGGGGGGT